jgi:hypothetical protein
MRERFRYESSFERPKFNNFFDDCLKFKNTNIFESIFHYSKHTIFKKKKKEA